MKQRFGPRTLVKLGLFVVLTVVVGNVVLSDIDNYASIGYPPIPKSHYQYIDDAIKHCNVPAKKRGLIAATAWKESTFNPEAQSGAGAIGVMQLLRGTGLGTANEYQIGGLNAATFTDPSINYKLGTCYLHSLVTRLSNSDQPSAWDDPAVVKAALIGYNAGPARGASYLRGAYNGPTSSIGYAERIMQAERVYSMDFARRDQSVVTGETDVLSQVREIVWTVLLSEIVKNNQGS